ncbi:MAG: DsrE family protein [Anaerolineales bacterium]|jgi:predicted peroxiredoxin|nr:DsrE family protein [Anaerolineales bacterium]
MSEENSKMVVVCNHADTPHVMPTLIMGASGVGIGDDVILFFCPGGAQALVKGELEKIGTPKGLPNPVELFNTILDEGGTVILCELALENKGIKVEDLRDERIVVKNAPSFLLEAEGAGLSLVF